jgi:hypothetical protein
MREATAVDILLYHIARLHRLRDLKAEGLSKGFFSFKGCQEKKIRNVKASTRKSPTKPAALRTAFQQLLKSRAESLQSPANE